MKEVKIPSNPETLSATLFKGHLSKTVLIIASATGVKQEFYKAFSQYIANTGTTVITFDYNGIGRSLNKPIKALKNNGLNYF